MISSVRKFGSHRSSIRFNNFGSVRFGSISKVRFARSVRTFDCCFEHEVTLKASDGSYQLSAEM